MFENLLLWNFVNIGLKLKEQASTESAKEILNVYNTIQENTTNSSLEILNVYNTTRENTTNLSLEIHNTPRENTTKSTLKILDVYNTTQENTTNSSPKIFNAYNTTQENTINSSLEAPLTEDEKINMKYCQEKTCKFVFPYYHPEQETRANIHTRSYTQLARSLNRTIVLTNVGNSRVQACFPYPFDFYYDIKAFQKQYPDIRFITQEKFFKWTQERKIKPIAQHSQMIQDGRHDSLSLREKKFKGLYKGVEMSRREKKKYCLDKFDLNITDYKEFHTGIEIKELNQKAMLNLVTNTLKIPPIAESEVIMILNTSPKEMLPKINKVIPYSPHIIKQTKSIIKKLKPYIAIHWRMEQGNPRLMPQCAKRLVKEVKKIQKKYGIKNVYFATDFPLNGDKAQSQTFHKISKFHKKSIEILEHIKFDTWISLDGFSQIRNNSKYEKEFKGSGIQGILDKLVCINAKYFLKGPEGCARTSSTFTGIIVNERTKLKKKCDLINIVSSW
ncbi:29344_t:CDS:2 [Gigaspora margarita]|uniref:GDP-fucose protein O-fucosyltransferase 2 n=1 Tax=Gigaspora margarita TaxID=4874 RepID=A0ABN7VI18_GIGMA|nr:29344_t:CDS:2 [Gigaspora margarita]